jgi:hypothetical protein
MWSVYSPVVIQILVKNICHFSVACDQVSIVCVARIFTYHTYHVCVFSLQSFIIFLVKGFYPLSITFQVQYFTW